MRNRCGEAAALLSAQRDLRAAALLGLSLLGLSLHGLHVSGLRVLPLRLRGLPLPGLRLLLRLPAMRLRGVRVRDPAVSGRRAERRRRGEGLDRVPAAGDARHLPAVRHGPEGLAASAGTRVLLGDQSPQEASNTDERHQS